MSILRLLRKTDSMPRTPRHHSIVTWEKGRVSASVVKLGKGAAELIGVAAAPVDGISHTSHPDLDRWAVGCDKALNEAEALTELSSGRKLVPDYVTMSIPAGVTETLSVLVSTRRSRADRTVSLDELVVLLRRAYRQAQDVLGAQGKSTSEDIVQGSVAEITLDEHAVLDPLGLRGEQLDVRVSFCLAPVEWIRALEIVAERLELSLSAIVPHHVVYASPLPDAAALLVLLDEQYSVISLVRHGRLEWSAMIEAGQRQIIDGAAGHMNLRGRQADAFMRLYRSGQLRMDIELQLARIFWAELRKWMVALAAQVKSGIGNSSVPHHVYFVDATRQVPEAGPSLGTPFWEQSLPFDSCPEVTQYSLNTVRNVLDCTAQASGAHYLLLRALAHHVAQLYAPGVNLDRTLAESIRWRVAGSR